MATNGCTTLLQASILSLRQVGRCSSRLILRTKVRISMHFLASLLTWRRRSPCHCFRLPSLCHPRDSTALRGGLMVLGSCAFQSTRHAFGCCEPQFVSTDHHTSGHCHCYLHVGDWRDTADWFAAVLPPSTRPYPVVLLIAVSTEDHHSKYHPLTANISP